MGVPKFYRWISERYPCLSEVLKDYQIPEFDNLYLDMNGIIHVCSHPEDDNPHFRITEEKIVTDIFHYIEVLFRMIKPKKVFFMAVDGVAPRAKMNQQRGRRFRSAREAEDLVRKALEKGEILPTEARFDSNCITPGTEFMARLHECLKYFVAMKVTTDRLWQGVRVILSGHETPGEGEHKIMDFIRKEKSSDGYDPNTRHCLYGLDADLIMLGLITHEPHFSLLREEVRFGGKKSSQKRSNTPEETTFHLLHLSVMREYLDFEFSSLKDKLPFPYDREHIINDWVLMGFLVGNDFIPHLPHMHIHHECLPKLWKCYKRVLPTLDGYLNEGGKLVLNRFEVFMEALSKSDTEFFSQAYADIKWMESKKAEKAAGNQAKSGASVTFPSTDIRKPRQKKSSLSSEDTGIPTAKNFMILKDIEDENEFSSFTLDSDDIDDDEDGSLEMAEAWEKDDKFMQEFVTYKANYYKEKMGFKEITEDVLRELSHGYIRAIQWVLFYYYNGVPSWSWFYPLHYAPYISDVRNFSSMEINFDYARPFLPFQQLMAVLPSASKNLLPKPYQMLMTSSNSPVIDFYPAEFEQDLNGKQQSWEAVVLIPFIEEGRLLSAMASVEDQLTAEEKHRNRHGPHVLSIYDEETYPSVVSPYASLPELINNHAKCVELPLDAFVMEPSEIKKGLCPGVRQDVFFPGFPTLKHLSHKARFAAMGVKVFQMNSRGENCILELDGPQNADIDKLAGDLLGKPIYADWPHLKEVLVVGLTSDEYRYMLPEDPQYKSPKKQKPVRESLSTDEMSRWCKEVQGLQDWCITRRGVDVGNTQILVTAKPLIGRKYGYGHQGRITLEKQWGKNSVSYLYQSCVKDIAVRDPSFKQYRTVDELYPANTEVFMLGNPHYGSRGKVLSVEQDGRIRIDFFNLLEPNLDQIKAKHQRSCRNYLRGFEAAGRLNISSHLLSRITGTVYVSKGKEGRNQPQRSNVGLNLKFNKTGKEVPGYTKKDDNEWKYSHRLVDIIGKYISEFPDLFEFLGGAGNDENYTESDIFSPEGPSLKTVCEFIKTLPCADVPPVPHGTQLLDDEVIRGIEQAVDNTQEQNKKKKKHTKMQVRPHLLFRPMDGMAYTVPDPSTVYELFDRVVNVRDGYSVPLGLKGTVTAILPAAKEQDVLYEVVFDETFLGGLTLRSSASRAYKMPPSSLINITHGRRKEQARKPDKPMAIVKPQSSDGSANSGKMSYSALLASNTGRAKGYDNYYDHSRTQVNQHAPRFQQSGGVRQQRPYNQPGNAQPRPTQPRFTGQPGQGPRPSRPQVSGQDQYGVFWSSMTPGAQPQGSRQMQHNPRHRGGGGHHANSGNTHQQVPAPGSTKQSHQATAPGPVQQRHQAPAPGPSLQLAAQALPPNLINKGNRGPNSTEPPQKKHAHQMKTEAAVSVPQSIDLKKLFSAADSSLQKQQQGSQSQNEFEAMFSDLSLAMEKDKPQVTPANAAGAPDTTSDSQSHLVQKQEDPGASSKPPPSYGRQLSVQELFQGAQSAAAENKNKNKNPPNSSSSSSSKVAELLLWCQENSLGEPCYEYQNGADKKVRAVVRLSSGQEFTGSFSRNIENTAESAAALALMTLKTAQVPMSASDPVLNPSTLSAFTPVKQGFVDSKHNQQLPYFNFGVPPPPLHGHHHHRQPFSRPHMHQFPPPGFQPRMPHNGPIRHRHSQPHPSQYRGRGQCHENRGHGYENRGQGYENRGQMLENRGEIKENITSEAKDLSHDFTSKSGNETPKKGKQDGRKTESTPNKNSHSAFIPTQVLRQQKTPKKHSDSPTCSYAPVDSVKTTSETTAHTSSNIASSTSHVAEDSSVTEKTLPSDTVTDNSASMQITDSDNHQVQSSDSQPTTKPSPGINATTEEAADISSSKPVNSRQRRPKSRIAANFMGGQ